MKEKILRLKKMNEKEEFVLSRVVRKKEYLSIFEDNDYYVEGGINPSTNKIAIEVGALNGNLKPKVKKALVSEGYTTYSKFATIDLPLVNDLAEKRKEEIKKVLMSLSTKSTDDVNSIIEKATKADSVVNNESINAGRFAEIVKGKDVESINARLVNYTQEHIKIKKGDKIVGNVLPMGGISILKVSSDGKKFIVGKTKDNQELTIDVDNNKMIYYYRPDNVGVRLKDEEKLELSLQGKEDTKAFTDMSLISNFTKEATKVDLGIYGDYEVSVEESFGKAILRVEKPKAVAMDETVKQFLIKEGFQVYSTVADKEIKRDEEVASKLKKEIIDKLSKVIGSIAKNTGNEATDAINKYLQGKSNVKIKHTVDSTLYKIINVEGSAVIEVKNNDVVFTWDLEEEYPIEFYQSGVVNIITTNGKKQLKYNGPFQTGKMTKAEGKEKIEELYKAIVKLNTLFNKVRKGEAITNPAEEVKKSNAKGITITDAMVVQEKYGEGFSIKINGVEYRYSSNAFTAQELFDNFNRLATKSPGRALKWLKDNSVNYYGGADKRKLTPDQVLSRKLAAEKAPKAEKAAKINLVSSAEQKKQLEKIQKYASKMTDLIDEDKDFSMYYLEEPQEFTKHKLQTVGLAVVCYDMTKSVQDLNKSVLAKKFNASKSLKRFRNWYETTDGNGTECMMIIYVEADYARRSQVKELKEGINEALYGFLADNKVVPYVELDSVVMYEGEFYVVSDIEEDFIVIMNEAEEKQVKASELNLVSESMEIELDRTLEVGEYLLFEDELLEVIEFKGESEMLVANERGSVYAFCY